MILNSNLRVKTLSVFLVVLSLLASTSPSFAETITSTLACSQSAATSADNGTLVLAAQSQQLTSTEWGTKQGCFKKYGLTVKTVPVSSSAIGLAGVIGGTYDLVATTPTNLIQAKINGNFAAKIIAPKHGYSVEELARARVEPLFPGELLLQTVVIVSADSKIATWRDLDKKKIALQTFQSADHAGVLLGIKSKGVRSPKSEFLVMPVPQMADALKRGDVDAVVANDPYATQMLLSGNKVIGYPQTFYAEPGAAVVFASSAEIASNKATQMRIFQKATLEINKLLNKKENEASFRKVLVEVTKVTAEAAAKAKLPIMEEHNVTIPELAYIPSKLKKVGFLKGRFELGPILFR